MSTAALSEAQWQQQVTDLLRLRNWEVYHTHDSRRSQPGFPDLVAVGHGRALFLELKSERGRLQPAQVRWLQALADAGLEVALLRPSDLPRLLAALHPVSARLDRYGKDI